jgi:hypothetical protein
MRHAHDRITRIGRARIVVIRRNRILHRPLLHIAGGNSARIPVICRQIASIKRGTQDTHTVANRGLAIVRRLRLDDGTLRRIRNAASSTHTCAGMAFRVTSGAIRGRITPNTIANSIANKRHTRATHRARVEWWIRWNAVRTHISRTIVLIVGQIVRVIGGYDCTRTIALIDFAVFCGL